MRVAHRAELPAKPGTPRQTNLRQPARAGLTPTAEDLRLPPGAWRSLELPAWCLPAGGALSAAAASPATGPSAAKSKTLAFKVVFSPPEFIQANNVRHPKPQPELGDEIV